MEKISSVTKTDSVVGHSNPVTYTAYPQPGYGQTDGDNLMFVPCLVAVPVDQSEDEETRTKYPTIFPGSLGSVNGLHLNDRMERMIGSVIWVKERSLLSEYQSVDSATPIFTSFGQMQSRFAWREGQWSYNDVVGVLNDSPSTSTLDPFYLCNTAVMMGNTNLANNKRASFTCIFEMNKAHKKRMFKEYQWGSEDSNVVLREVLQEGTLNWTWRKDWLIPLSHDDLLQIQALYSSVFGQILWANKFLQFSELNDGIGVGEDGAYNNMISSGRNVRDKEIHSRRVLLSSIRSKDDRKLMLHYEGQCGNISANFYQWGKACSKMEETLFQGVAGVHENPDMILDTHKFLLNGEIPVNQTYGFEGSEVYSKKSGFYGNPHVADIRRKHLGHQWALTQYQEDFGSGLRADITFRAPRYFISMSHEFIPEAEYTSHSYDTKFNTHPLFYSLYAEDGDYTQDIEMVTLVNGDLCPKSMAMELDLSYKNGVITWYGKTEGQNTTPIGYVSTRCIPVELVFEEEKPLVRSTDNEWGHVVLTLLFKDEHSSSGLYSLKQTKALTILRSEFEDGLNNDAFKVLIDPVRGFYDPDHRALGGKSYVFGDSRWTEEECVYIGSFSCDYDSRQETLILQDDAIYPEDSDEVYTRNDVGYNVWEHSDGYYYTYEQPELRHEYHNGPRGDFRTKETIYGIGFEVEKEDSSPLYDYDLYETDNLMWARESDGSLDDETGFELVSPIYDLMTDKLDTDLENRILKDHINADYSSNCGGHINFSIRGKDGIEAFRSVSSFIPLIVALYKGRWDAGYSRIKRKPHQYESGDKYSAINVRSRMVEFRIFSAVKNVTNLLWRRDLMRLMVKYIDTTPVKILGLLTDSRSDLHKHLLKVYDANRMLQITLLYAQLADDMYDTQKFTKDGNGLMFTTAIRSLKRKKKPQQLVLGFAFENFTNLQNVFGSSFKATNKTSIDWVVNGLSHQFDTTYQSVEDDDNWLS